jgi:4-hydroxy-tetrahydrodipicolinate synthase
VPPLVTPFTEDGEAVDELGLRSLVDRTIEDGADGLIACGSTGEYVAMTDDERRHVTETVCSQADGRVPVVAHVGALRTRQAVELTRHAASSGATAVMAISHFYGPLSGDRIRAYYSAIAEASELPIVIYNLPSTTGRNLEPDYLESLAREIPAVRYVKDSTGDLSQIARLTFAGEIGVLNGIDTLFLPALTLGVVGSIVGSGNVVTRELSAIASALYEGRLQDAMDAFRKLFPLLRFLATNGAYAAGVKEALDLAGRSAGPPRAPHARLDAPARERLRSILERLGLAAAPSVA